MLDTMSEWVMGIIIITLLLCVAWQVAHPIMKVVTVEKEVVKEIPVDHIVKIPQDCAPCTITVERVIEKPCPERKCQCTASGAFGKGNGSAWWYAK